jgi:hypothetical protein
MIYLESLSDEQGQVQHLLHTECAEEGHLEAKSIPATAETHGQTFEVHSPTTERETPLKQTSFDVSSYDAATRAGGFSDVVREDEGTDDCASHAQESARRRQSGILILYDAEYDAESISEASHGNSFESDEFNETARQTGLLYAHSVFYKNRPLQDSSSSLADSKSEELTGMPIERQVPPTQGIESDELKSSIDSAKFSIDSPDHFQASPQPFEQPPMSLPDVESDSLKDEKEEAALNSSLRSTYFTQPPILDATDFTKSDLMRRRGSSSSLNSHSKSACSGKADHGVVEPTDLRSGFTVRSLVQDLRAATERVNAKVIRVRCS